MKSERKEVTRSEKEMARYKRKKKKTYASVSIRCILRTSLQICFTE